MVWSGGKLLIGYIPFHLLPRLRVRRRPSRLAHAPVCLHGSVVCSAMQKLRIVMLGLARRDRKRSLNDGQTPNPNAVRVAPGTGYHRVEGNRRASRSGLVSDLPPETIGFS